MSGLPPSLSACFAVGTVTWTECIGGLYMSSSARKNVCMVCGKHEGRALFSETTRLAGLAKKLAEQIALASQHALLAALAASIISIGLGVTTVRIALQFMKILGGAAIALLHVWSWMWFALTASLLSLSSSPIIMLEARAASDLQLERRREDRGTRRSRKPLLLPTDGDIRNQASKEGMKDTFLSDVGYQDDSCSREYEPELKPCCHLFDNEKGIVWSPNAAYNADLSCFT